MGRIANILSFLRVTRRDAKVSDVKLDTGGGANITAEHFSSPGDDSFPLTTDYAITVDIPRSGGGAVVGYIDPINAPVSLEGEKRIYSRDPADGSVKAETLLKNTGDITSTNENGEILLLANGTIACRTIISGVEKASVFLSPNGDVIINNEIAYILLYAGGDVEINGVTIDTSGNITTTGTITAGTVEATTSLKAGPTGSEVVGHDHVIASGSSSPGPTGPLI